MLRYPTNLALDIMHRLSKIYGFRTVRQAFAASHYSKIFFKIRVLWFLSEHID